MQTTKEVHLGSFQGGVDLFGHVVKTWTEGRHKYRTAVTTRVEFHETTSPMVREMWGKTKLHEPREEKYDSYHRVWIPRR